MLVATAVIAVSVTVTLIYLIFYSASLATERVLNHTDWNFKLLAIYVLTFVFLGAELGLNPIRASPQHEAITLGLIL